MMKVYDVMQSSTVNRDGCMISPLMYGSEDTVHFVVALCEKSLKPNMWITCFGIVQIQNHLALASLNIEFPSILLFCRTPWKLCNEM